MLKRALHSARNWISRPPYDGVPWIVWLYAVFCCACYPHGGVFAGHLSGFDDHTRMTAILDWVNGAGWYDRTIHRANAPEGLATIWSRLTEIPTAAVIVLAQFFTDQKHAALIAATVVPFAELGLLFPVARYFARPLVGRDKAWLIILFLMFTTVMNYSPLSIAGFHTGEASHHPWYIILALIMFGAAGRMAVGVPGYTPCLTLGFAVSLLLAVGIEGLPLIAGTYALLTIIAFVFNGAVLARKVLISAVIGSIGGLILLPLHQPFSEYFKVSFAEPSLLGPVLVGTAALFLFVEWLLMARLKPSKKASVFLLLLLAILLCAVLLHIFPQMRDGAAAALSPEERKMAANEHFEAQPLWKATSIAHQSYLALAMPTFIALVSGLIAIRSTHQKRRRALYIAYFGFALIGGGMAERFTRYIHHALTTACPWLLWTWERIKQRLTRDKNYSLKKLTTFILLGPFWMLFLPAFTSDAPILSQVFLYPSKVQSNEDHCDVMTMAFYINDHYGNDKTLIVPNWDSSRFLYHTDLHISFVANYPSHDGFIDNEKFFVTRDAEEARALTDRHNINLVAVCKFPLMLDIQHPLNQQRLIGLLQTGRPPAWLKPVDTQLPGNYLLYEVDKTSSP